MKLLKLIPMFLLLCVIAACGAEKKNDSNSGDTGGNTPPPPTPAASLYPQFSVSELRFDETQINTSTEKTVTIRYTGATPYDVTISNMPATPFSIAQGGCVLSGSTLSVSSTCDLKFTFTPTEVKNYFATLSTNIGRVLFAASGIDGNNKPVWSGKAVDLEYDITSNTTIDFASSIKSLIVIRNDTDVPAQYNGTLSNSSCFSYAYDDDPFSHYSSSTFDFTIKPHTSYSLKVGTSHANACEGFETKEAIITLKNSSDTSEIGKEYYLSSDHIAGAGGHCSKADQCMNPTDAAFEFDLSGSNKIAGYAINGYENTGVDISAIFDPDFFTKFRLDPRSNCVINTNNSIDMTQLCMLLIIPIQGGTSNLVATGTDLEGTPAKIIFTFRTE